MVRQVMHCMNVAAVCVEMEDLAKINVYSLCKERCQISLSVSEETKY